LGFKHNTVLNDNERLRVVFPPGQQFNRHGGLVLTLCGEHQGDFDRVRWCALSDECRIPSEPWFIRTQNRIEFL